MSRPSVNLLDTIKQALQRQAWYADHQREQGAEPLAFVGRFSLHTNPRTVACDTRQEEVACNAIAGGFLAPEETFRAAWAQASPELPVRLAALARRFHVSQLVVARRALDQGLIDRETYSAFYLSDLERFRQAESQGGSYYRNAGSKNSTRFACAVIAEAFSGRLLLREAGKLLGVQPAKLRAFAEQLGP